MMVMMMMMMMVVVITMRRRMAMNRLIDFITLLADAMMGRIIVTIFFLAVIISSAEAECHIIIQIISKNASSL